MISRDKQHHKTGTSDSDQVMARALMTPDELRRLDNDLCIIFEKGIKPVKANKFYYFKHKIMANNLKNAEISHNDIGEIQRGSWRKFNPYNPWSEDKAEKEAQNLKVESLDDLFDDDSSSQKDETAKKEEVDNTKLSQTLENSNTTNNDMISLGNLESAEKSQKASIITDEEYSYDLQKELEAKFDELFGPIDEE